jgi:hypothetical protein
VVLEGPGSIPSPGCLPPCRRRSSHRSRVSERSLCSSIRGSIRRTAASCCGHQSSAAGRVRRWTRAWLCVASVIDRGALREEPSDVRNWCTRAASWQPPNTSLSPLARTSATTREAETRESMLSIAGPCCALPSVVRRRMSSADRSAGAAFMPPKSSWSLDGFRAGPSDQHVGSTGFVTRAE